MDGMSSAPGDQAATPSSSAPDRESTPEELAAQQGVPARGASHYAKGTSANMVRSMVVIVGLALALFLVTGRPNSVTPQAVDVSAAAEYRAAEAGEPFAYADQLRDGWTATSVRYVRSKGGVMVWNAGYTTPDGEFVSVQQAVDPGQAWIDTQTNNGRPVGSVETSDGREWTKRDREGKVQRSLVNVPDAKGELTTLVTGTGSWEQLQAFAEHLTPAKVTKAGGSASPSASPSS